VSLGAVELKPSSFVTCVSVYVHMEWTQGGDGGRRVLVRKNRSVYERRFVYRTRQSRCRVYYHVQQSPNFSESRIANRARVFSKRRFPGGNPSPLPEIFLSPVVGVRCNVRNVPGRICWRSFHLAKTGALEIVALTHSQLTQFR